MSWASRAQGTLTTGDSLLTNRARKAYPMASHWWGVFMARRPSTWGARCYLHSPVAVVARWEGPTQEGASPSNAELPRSARLAILEHRLEHLAGLRRRPGGRAGLAA